MFDSCCEFTTQNTERIICEQAPKAVYCIYDIHMSCGRNYVHGELAMSKLGGPLSVMKVLNFLSFDYMK